MRHLPMACRVAVVAEEKAAIADAPVAVLEAVRPVAVHAEVLESCHEAPLVVERHDRVDHGLEAEFVDPHESHLATEIAELRDPVCEVISLGPPRARHGRLTIRWRRGRARSRRRRANARGGGSPRSTTP